MNGWQLIATIVGAGLLGFAAGVWLCVGCVIDFAARRQVSDDDNRRLRERLHAIQTAARERRRHELTVAESASAPAANRDDRIGAAGLTAAGRGRETSTC